MKRSKRKMAVLAGTALMLGIFLNLSGCSRGQSVNALPSETEQDGQEISDEDYDAVGSAGTMLETAQKLYFKYGNALWRVDKKSEQIEKLYEFKKLESNSLFWIYGGHLYFDIDPAPLINTGEKIGLYKLDVATKKTERILDLPALPMTLFAADDILYVRGYGMDLAYRLDKKGKIKENVPAEDTIYGMCPKGGTELSKESIPYLVHHYGYMALTSPEGLIIADKDGANVRTMNELAQTSSVLCAEDAIYAMIQKKEGEYVCRRYDIGTLQGNDVFEEAAFPVLLQVRDGKLYYLISSSDPSEKGSRQYYEIDLKNGEKKMIVTMDEEPGYFWHDTFYGNFFVGKDGIYCQKTKDYNLYIEKLSPLKNEKEVLLKPAIYESNISKLGHVEAKSGEIKCKCGEKTAAKTYVEKLVLKGDSDAAKAMNQVLQEDFKKELQYAKELIHVEDEEGIHNENFSAANFTYTVGKIQYLDERYVCIQMEGNEYTGGLRGESFKNDFIFDRQTGKRLKLSDIVGVSEKELKVLVSGQFRDLAQRTEFAFEAPEELEVTVEQSTSYDSRFYMAEDGLVFYYAPYSIAPYTAGFPEVTIPYKDLNIKINLEKK